MFALVLLVALAVFSGVASAQDTTPPITSLETSPTAADGLNGWFKTTPTITLTRSEPGTTYYQWDSTLTAWTTYSGSFSGLEGQHALYYYSADTDGNTETVRNQLVKVDTGIPTDPTATSPSHTTGTPSNDNTIDISFSGATDTVSGVDGFSIEWSRAGRVFLDRFFRFLSDKPLAYTASGNGTLVIQ